MRKLIVSLLTVLGLLVITVAVIILLNFTATNPTGRRYSSQIVQIGGQSDEIGRSGERILGHDLGLPLNESIGQRQCLCHTVDNTPPKALCMTCVTYAPIAADYRIPDFVGRGFIAESKNGRNLLYVGDSREIGQINDYVIGARTLKRPLWVYTRVDTKVSPDFVEIVRSTGGDVVPYFAVPGWVDPWDELGRQLLLIGGGMLVSAMVVMRLSPFKLRRAPEPEPMPTDDAQGFLKQAREKARRTIDKEDARLD